MPNVTVYDLDNYPDNGKTVTVALASVVAVGAEGDEEWVISATTNGYSDIANRTSIQNLYIRDIRAGWAKSSGLRGGVFTIDSGSKTLGIKMDAVSNIYYIELETGTNLPGDDIASDIETKIRAIPDSGAWSSSDDGYRLAYINASVEFVNNKFYIVAGSRYPTMKNSLKNFQGFLNVILVIVRLGGLLLLSICTILFFFLVYVLGKMNTSYQKITEALKEL